MQRCSATIHATSESEAIFARYACTDELVCYVVGGWAVSYRLALANHPPPSLFVILHYLRYARSHPYFPPPLSPPMQYRTLLTAVSANAFMNFYAVGGSAPITELVPKHELPNYLFRLPILRDGRISCLRRAGHIPRVMLKCVGKSPRLHASHCITCPPLLLLLLLPSFYVARPHFSWS